MTTPNPWTVVPAADYEPHMGPQGVDQLAPLSAIFPGGLRGGPAGPAARVHRHQRRVEEMPGADYKGGQELVTPLGSAFYSRGRYLAGAELVEDAVLVAKHPSSNRLLVISYHYSAGADSSVRVQQLLEIVSVVQAIGGGAPAAGE